MSIKLILICINLTLISIFFPLTWNKAVAVIPSALFTLELTDENLYVNREFKVDLGFQTNAQVSGIDATVIFEPANLTAVKIIENKLLAVSPKSIIDNELGIIKISQISSNSNAFIGKEILASIYFRPKTSGEHLVSFDYTPTFKKDSNAISLFSGEDILLTPQDLIITVQENETPTKDKPVQPKVAPQPLQEEFLETNKLTPKTFITRVFEFFPNAIQYIGETYFGFKPKVKVTLGSLAGGDLNNDGVINSDDEQIFLSKWYTRGFADFNHDGIVNSADHWINSKNYQHNLP